MRKLDRKLKSKLQWPYIFILSSHCNTIAIISLFNDNYSLSCTCAVAQNTPTFYMAVNLIVNVETTFFVLKFVISLLKSS